MLEGFIFTLVDFTLRIFDVANIETIFENAKQFGMKLLIIFFIVLFLRQSRYIFELTV